MAKYRKKPVEVQAVTFIGFGEPHFSSRPQWLRDAIYRDERIRFFGPEGKLEIVTLEGIMLASPGDYIIRGVQGELYPCKPDIFEATYEPA